MNRFLFAVALLFQPFVALAKEDEVESALTALCEEVSDPFDRLMFMHQSHDVIFRQTMGNGLSRVPGLNTSHEMGEDLTEIWRSEHPLESLGGDGSHWAPCSTASTGLPHSVAGSVAKSV